ncbi:MAG: hypothetical protein HYX94_03125 [Chloroflexi bacterium]|nr:hypothetical protein [Chloroflexota bacterium]
MVNSASNRMLILVALVGVMTLFAWLARPNAAAALPDYAAKTGQPCSTCHVNPAGGGPLTATGSAFQAIPTHTSDPAGAFAQVTAATRPAPAPSPSTTTPSTTTPSTTAPTTPAAPSAAALPKAGDTPLVGTFVAVGVMLVMLGLIIRKAIASR